MVCEIENIELKEFLLYIQNKLFVVGSYLATETEAHSPTSAQIITDKDIEALETIMDNMDAHLPKLTRFILPGGVSQQHEHISVEQFAEEQKGMSIRWLMNSQLMR